MVIRMFGIGLVFAAASALRQDNAVVIGYSLLFVGLLLESIAVGMVVKHAKGLPLSYDDMVDGQTYILIGQGAIGRHGTECFALLLSEKDDDTLIREEMMARVYRIDVPLPFPDRSLLVAKKIRGRREVSMYLELVERKQS